jgi:hypothetical protein
MTEQQEAERAELHRLVWAKERDPTNALHRSHWNLLKHALEGLAYRGYDAGFRTLVMERVEHARQAIIGTS